MTWRVTPLALSLLTVIGWIVSLAVLTARADLLVVAVPLALGLATLARRTAPPDYTLVRRFSRDRLLEGETVTVEVEVTARSTIPFMELLDPLTEVGTVITGRPRAVLAIPRGETARNDGSARAER